MFTPAPHGEALLGRVTSDRAGVSVTPRGGVMIACACAEGRSASEVRRRRDLRENIFALYAEIEKRGDVKFGEGGVLQAKLQEGDQPEGREATQRALSSKKAEVKGGYLILGEPLSTAKASYLYRPPSAFASAQQLQ